MALDRSLLNPIVTIVFAALCLPALVQAAPPRPVVGTQGMVVTDSPLASDIGLEVLKNGGNAVDAAVAVGFAMAVTYPYAGSLGGGGFMLIHHPTQDDVALDFREQAPLAATRDMYLDGEGNVVRALSAHGALAAGVPGNVAGLLHAHERWGSQALKSLLKPSINLAKNGFEVPASLAKELEVFRGRLTQYPSSSDIFYPGGQAPKQGDVFVQADLAKSLQAISRKGRAGFYEGAVADLIVEQMTQSGGIISHQDLIDYKVIERKPVAGEYNGFEVVSMPPPSSGGVHLLQMLNILEPYPLSYLGHNSAETMHLMTESMRRAYADRAVHLGDPEHYEVPIDGLTSEGYADYQRSTIDRYKASLSSEITAGDPSLRGPKLRGYVQPAYLKEGQDTTHFSIVDKDGMAVSCTYTINFPYGNAMVVDGAGFLLNNEMDDFSAKPGVPNAYGLVGSEANAIEPGKRPLSSMTPTIVLKDGDVALVTGSPGGSRIITTTLQVVLNVTEFQMPVSEAVASPRFHHQWLPDQLQVEPGISVDTLNLLGNKGHHIGTRATMGSANSVAVENGKIYGASDPRRAGKASGY